MTTTKTHLPSRAFRKGGSRFILLAVAVVVLLALASCSSGGERLDVATVRVGGAAFTAEIAKTPAARTKGLGGREALARDAGMLFVFPEPGRETFWMKDVSFPLDFVWISAEREVVQLTENVPPDDGQDADLPLYKPDQDVQYVVELAGGVVMETGIAVGDAVSFEPDVYPADAR